MKNILLGLFLFLSFQSFAQNNFREMSWGDSVSQLKSLYPSVKWEIETDEKLKVYATEDYVGGLEVKVLYSFIENKFQIGGYYFIVEHSSDNLYYEDFISISNILNKKYDMEIEKKWNDTTWKNNHNFIGHALIMGDVEIRETYDDKNISITHSISSDNYGGIQHVLVYYDMEYVKSQRDSVLDDF